MLSTERSLTAELVAEARRTYRFTHERMEELTEITEKAADTMRFLRWWQFLDYDPKALDFIKKLDQ